MQFVMMLSILLALVSMTCAGKQQPTEYEAAPPSKLLKRAGLLQEAQDYAASHGERLQDMKRSDLDSYHKQMEAEESEQAKREERQDIKKEELPEPKKYKHVLKAAPALTQFNCITQRGGKMFNIRECLSEEQYLRVADRVFHVVHEALDTAGTVPPRGDAAGSVPPTGDAGVSTGLARPSHYSPWSPTTDIASQADEARVLAQSRLTVEEIDRELAHLRQLASSSRDGHQPPGIWSRLEQQHQELGDVLQRQEGPRRQDLRI